MSNLDLINCSTEMNLFFKSIDVKMTYCDSNVSLPKRESTVSSLRLLQT